LDEREKTSMSFESDFDSCLSPLPPPSGVVDSVGDLLEFLERLHTAWEQSGGNDEMLLVALAATVPELAGVAEAAADAATVTVIAYALACAGCAAKAAGPAIWDILTAANDGWAKQAVMTAANDAGIPHDTAVA
jgi:hypothetical protein